MSRTNYVFVDFENVQELELDRITNKPVKVVLVLGERNKKLDLHLVKGLLKHCSRVQLVETGRSGKNALDLILAHHIGEAKKADPHGYFHIISRDKDFDALIGHLRDGGTLAARHASFDEIPLLMNKNERIKFVTERLKPKPATRPAKRKTLESQIQAWFGKALSAAELDDTIKGLIAGKAIQITPKDEIVYLI